MSAIRKGIPLALCLLCLLFPAFSRADTGISIKTLAPTASPAPSPTEEAAEGIPTPAEYVIPVSTSSPSPSPSQASEAPSVQIISSVPTPVKIQVNGMTGSSGSSEQSGQTSNNSNDGSVSISLASDSSMLISDLDGDVPVYKPYSTLPPLEETDTHYTLPIDFSAGKTPVTDGYITDYEYEDPTIHVKIERGREDDCTFWICEVRIADASQLRTASADGFDSNMTMPGAAIARRVNAVVAIDGDYFCYTGRGYILRQGHLYLDRTTGGRDVLMIDEDGDFHIIRKAKRNECSETIDGKKVINAFFFGPVLVENGVLGTEFRYTDMAYDLYSQRMAIAQVGKLHYKIICCESPKRGSSGMTLKQFAEFCQGIGVDTAYNLDGGDSTMLIFRNHKLNDTDNPHTRDIADIIYFASAYSQE